MFPARRRRFPHTVGCETPSEIRSRVFYGPLAVGSRAGLIVLRLAVCRFQGVVHCGSFVDHLWMFLARRRGRFVLGEFWT